MGVLVDVVRHAVAPVLQELRRRPGVVDLVEVHRVRLGQAEGPRDEREDHDHDEEPQVEPVEPPATLAVQPPRPVGQEGSNPTEPERQRQARPDHARQALAASLRARRRRRAIEPSTEAGSPTLDAASIPAEAVAGTGGRPLPSSGADRRRPRSDRSARPRPRPPPVPRARRSAPRRRAGGPPGAELRGDPDEDREVDDGDDRHAGLRADGVAHAQPVGDAGVARVGREQDAYRLAKLASASDHVGDPPADRDGAPGSRRGRRTGTGSARGRGSAGRRTRPRGTSRPRRASAVVDQRRTGPPGARPGPAPSARIHRHDRADSDDRDDQEGRSDVQGGIRR